MKKILVFIISILFTGCSFFNSSKEIELIPFIQKEKFGYFNLEGKIVINPQFAFASAFRDNIALVKTTGNDGKWGFIDNKGKFVINPTFKDATVFQEGLAWVVTENSSPSAIDTDGKIKFTLKEAEEVRLFKEGLAAFSKADSTTTIWGFVDKSGKQIINPQFKSVGDFSDDKCSVENKEGKWGYIDKSGKIIINYQFDNALKFIDGKAIVYLDDKAGVIDEEGKYIINPQFKFAYQDKDSYLIYQDDKVGWCDKEGKIIINPQFDGGLIFGDNKLACIKSSDKYGYIDKEGKFVINPQFDDASQFINNVAIVKTGDKYGLIDKKGKYIVNPQFEDIGYDLYSYLSDNSIKSSISSDYLDVNKILKVINVNNPEKLSFEDNFKTILIKMNKSAEDFSAYGDTHTFFENKYISNEASYSFAIMGKLKDFSIYDYNYHVTNEKPQAFVYLVSLSGKAYDKSETIQKAFEERLKNYSLIKRGYIDNRYTSVYKSEKNIIITSSTSSNNSIFYIVKKDFNISSYLNKITEKSTSVSSSFNNYDDSVAADTTAVEAVDTTAAPAAY